MTKRSRRRGKEEPKLVYSTDKVAIVRQARQTGMSDGEILAALVANEYGNRAREKIIREWAPALAMTVNEALEFARRTGLVR
jgi:hypothetical protein